jgi:signal transduction histidine kinase
LPNRKRTNAEAKISLRPAVFQRLFESLPGLFLVIRPNLEIVAVSDAYLQTTMRRREDLIGISFAEAFPPNLAEPNETSRSMLRESLERVLRTGLTDSPGIRKYDIRRPDGTFEERFWSIVNAPVKDLDGKVEYIVHRVENVTDYVRQTAGAEESEAATRSRMARMESEIFNTAQRLQAVNQRLAGVNAELDAFTHSVSHDLRAPLRHIQGYADLLIAAAGDELQDTARRYLDTIVASSVDMGRLIDGLLSYSRAGREELRSQIVHLDTVVSDSIQDLQLETRSRRINWKRAELPSVRGDVSALRQVYTNLLGNAVKYTRKRDSAEIEIGCAGHENGRVILFVRDNGVGFDMHYVDKLFGVFQRLHTAEEFEGTGIGLATVQRVIERHGGRTWAEGAIDRGTTIYFTLEPSAD